MLTYDVLTWLAGDAISVLWSPCSACGLNNYALLQFYPPASPVELSRISCNGHCTLWRFLHAKGGVVEARVACGYLLTWRRPDALQFRVMNPLAVPALNADCRWVLVPRQSPLLTAALGAITHRPSPLGSMRCHGRFVMRSPSSLGASERSPHLSCRSCAIGRTLLSLSPSLFLWPAAAPMLLLLW